MLSTGCETPAGPPARVVPVNSVAGRLAWRTGRVPLDYARPELWPCRGEASDTCNHDYPVTRIVTDGTQAPAVLHTDPAAPVDCFFIYPTVDFNVFQSGNHDDMNDIELPRRTIETQAGPFTQVCRVFAPFYRQGTFGAYDENTAEAADRFRAAFVDVAAAFEYYLAHWNHGRPIVIFGHSQGAQHASYLLHQYFDGDIEVTGIDGSRTSGDLRARLVVGLPIGYDVYVPKGQAVGGSFSDIPLCSAVSRKGCVIHYRSYPEGYSFKPDPGDAIDRALAVEGFLYTPYDADRHEVACVNPALGAPLPVSMATDATGATVAPGDIRLVTETQLVGLMALLHAGVRTAPAAQALPGRYTAACRNDPKGGNYLAIGLHKPAAGIDARGDPVASGGFIATGDTGLHLYDFNLQMADLVEQVRRKSRN